MERQLDAHRSRHHGKNKAAHPASNQRDRLAYALHAHDGCEPLFAGRLGSLEGATHDMDMVGRNGYVSGSASTVGGHP